MGKHRAAVGSSPYSDNIRSDLVRKFSLKRRRPLMQEIGKEINEKFNLDIKSIVPYKDAYILATSRGKKILKKTVLSPERLLFIHSAKEHLYKNGFTHTDRYLCTVDGLPYVPVDYETFVLYDSIEGEECNFDSRTDIEKAAKLLAAFHSASRGFKPHDRCKVRDDLGKLPVYFGKRLEEIKKLRKVAKKGKSRFDYLFTEYVDSFYNLGENAIRLLSESRYHSLVEATRREGLFCHHDFTHHNIICSDNRTSLINFDFCCFELKIYDIANFLRRKMRKCNWDIHEARFIIDKYRTIENISDDEFFVLKIILQFPQKFWRVVNKYYNSNHSWAERSYILKLQEVIEEARYHKAFMDRYDLLGEEQRV